MRFVEQHALCGGTWRKLEGENGGMKMVIFHSMHMKFSGIKKMIIKINAVH